MSTPGLFLAGTLVTLIVAVAVGLLVYAAMLDGRDDEARRRRPVDPSPPAVEPPARAEADGGLPAGVRA